MHRLFFLLVSTLVLLLVACLNQQAGTDSDSRASPTAVPTIIPTFTPLPAATPAAAATSTSSGQAVSPTATSQPTNTPLPTTTPTAAPTDLPQTWLTPEPPPVDSSAYRLVPWSPERAESLARLMERYYAEVMIYFYGSASEIIYRAAFRYAGLAYREALLLYPDDPRLPRWRMAEIAHRVASNDSRSTDLYLEALSEALQTGAANLSQEALTTWLDQYPLFFSIQIDHLPPLHGFTGSHIVTIASAYDVGAASYWVLEKEGTFTIYPIHSNLGNYIAAEYHIYLADLTGNGVSEFIVDAQMHSGTIRGTNIAVYDLSQPLPTQLSFGPDLPRSIRTANFISISTKPINGGFLHVHSGDFFACPLQSIGTFFWNGQWFEQVLPTIDEQAIDYSNCLYHLNEAVERDIWSDNERTTILHLYESKFGDTPSDDGWPYGIPEQPLAEFQQEIRYILAMNHALLGNVEETVAYLSLIGEGEWLAPAQRFLDRYETAVDTYPACVAAGVKCDPRQALVRTVASLPATNGEATLARLVELGVPIRESGLFDADRDQKPEYWFSLRHPGREENELWLLAQSDTGIKALFIDSFNDRMPHLRNHPVWSTASVYGSTPGYFLFTIGVTDEVYAFVRRLTDREPYVIKLEGREPWLPPVNPQAAILDEAVDDLLAGGDPSTVIDRLLALADTPEFEPTAHYYYYLGLAYELAADETNAVTHYWLAWQDCCVTWESAGIETPNPFALMARAKLELIDE